MIYFCCDERRRQLVRNSANQLNGIDFLEVLDTQAQNDSDRQRWLYVHFLKDLDLGANHLDKSNILIEGGERIRGITAVKTFIGGNQPDGIVQPKNVLIVQVSQPGDYSIYRLRLVRDAQHAGGTGGEGEPPTGMDPVLSVVSFSFKVECPSDFDCAPKRICPPETKPEAEIDYLAKDYNSFRQLMLDRMSVLMPEWTERNAADEGIALIELFAYIGDHLSYQQDAVATEAYLDTARQRISVRRHALLVDYFMDDGCNARTWVHFDVDTDDVVVGRGARLITRVAGVGAVVDPQSNPGAEQMRLVDAARSISFETMQDVILFNAHNTIRFYTWGDERCCLPAGATVATLSDDPKNRLRLCAGDVLIFEEQKGARTGNYADANPTHRQAVRLTRVAPSAEPIFKISGQSLSRFRASGIPKNIVDQLVLLKDVEFVEEQDFLLQLQTTIGADATNSYQAIIERFSRSRRASAASTDVLNGELIVEIEWCTDDALLFPLCTSSTGDDSRSIPDVSVARGNIVLADHGLTVIEELGTPLPPDDSLATVTNASRDCCEPQDSTPTLPPYRPRLSSQPLTQVAPRPLKPINTKQTNLNRDSDASASAVYRWEMRDVLPSVTIVDHEGRPWQPKRDLLSSDEFAKEFVAEVGDDGYATLRFGDDQHGLRPAPKVGMTATYRVGNGKAGNVGAEALVHLISDGPITGITGLRNPMAARGGAEPETVEHVRRIAPDAFRIQERAVTPEDYVEVARRHREVQNAAATLRWTGSWRTIFLTIDRLGGRPVDSEFEQDLRRYLERYRMAGQDLEIDSPQFVALEIEMTVCVKPEYFRSDIEAGLLRIFSSQTQPDGSRGVFHPDNFSFGQPVYLSTLYAAAQKLDGVRFVTIPKFCRLGTKSTKELETGVLQLQRLEVARLDNDPNFAERGVFRLTMEGGK
jgi:Baseplate J-like protein